MKKPPFSPATLGNVTPEDCRIMNNVWRALKWPDTPVNRAHIWMEYFRPMTAVELYKVLKAQEVARELAA